MGEASMGSPKELDGESSLGVWTLLLARYSIQFNSLFHSTQSNTVFTVYQVISAYEPAFQTDRHTPTHTPTHTLTRTIVEFAAGEREEWKASDRF